MGVKACERAGCDKIVCDTLLRLPATADEESVERYVCPRCLAEMRELKERVWTYVETPFDVGTEIRKFLRTRRSSTLARTSTDVDVIFRQLTQPEDSRREA